MIILYVKYVLYNKSDLHVRFVIYSEMKLNENADDMVQGHWDLRTVKPT